MVIDSAEVIVVAAECADAHTRAERMMFVVSGAKRVALALDDAQQRMYCFAKAIFSLRRTASSWLSVYVSRQTLEAQLCLVVLYHHELMH